MQGSQTVGTPQFSFSEVRTSRATSRISRILVVALMLGLLPFLFAAAAFAATDCELVADPTTQDVGENIVATFTVTDSDTGEPVVGTSVNFSIIPVPGGGGSGGTIQPAATVTDENGVATATATATDAGEYRIIANAQSAPDGPCQDFVDVTFLAAEPASVVLSPAEETNTVGEPHTVTATVRDEFGNLVDDGEEVTFTVSPQDGVDDPEEVTTTTNGVATHTFTSTKSGTYNVTATSGGVTSNTATKTYTAGGVTDLALEPATDTNTVGDTHRVTATATDEFGNGVPGRTVSFTVAGTGGEAPTEGADATNEDGEAYFEFTSTKTGTSTITATLGAFTTTAEKTWVVGTPDRVVLSPATDTNKVGDEHVVTATVTDEFGNLRGAGDVVTFTVEGTGGEDPTQTVTETDENGIATFTFTSTRTGTSTITGRTSTGEGTATKNWTAGTQPPGGDPTENAYEVIAPDFVEANICFPIQIFALDEFGNRTTSDDQVAIVSESNDDDGSQLRIFEDASCGRENNLATLENGTTTVYGRDADTEVVDITVAQIGGTRVGRATVEIIPAPCSKPAVVRNRNAAGQAGLTWFLNTGFDGFAEIVYGYGNVGDIPLFGDWNGDGIDTSAVVRGNTWFIDVDGNRTADIIVTYGNPGDYPVAGDWNGDGIDTIGVVRGEGLWFLNNGFDSFADITPFLYGNGISTDQPFAGNWAPINENADPDEIELNDTPAIVRNGTGWFQRWFNTAGIGNNSFRFGDPGDRPVMGDWNCDNVDSIGAVRGNRWLLSDINEPGFAQYDFRFGDGGDIFLTWNSIDNEPPA